MLITAVCMINSEEILAESAVRYWLTFCDLVIIYNHNSIDGTTDILNALREEYPDRLILFQPDFPVGFEYLQKDITNAMIHKAFQNFHADIVMSLDVDEFPYTTNPKMAVHAFLCSLDMSNCYRVSCVPFSLPQEGIKLDLSRFIPLSFRLRRTPLFLQSPKSILTRGSYLDDPIFVEMGNHFMFRTGGKALPPIINLSPSIYYAHYPYQSISQFKAKNAIGWLASYCNPSWIPGVSYHLERCIEQTLGDDSITPEVVNWDIYTSFGETGESISDIQFEEIDPSSLFPDIPLQYTEQFSKKKDVFTLLLEQSLSIAKQYKEQQEEIRRLREKRTVD